MNEIFWTMVVSSAVMVLMGLAKLISKSRCDQISCCGCKIHRNVFLENEEAHLPETKENV